MGGGRCLCLLPQLLLALVGLSFASLPLSCISAVRVGTGGRPGIASTQNQQHCYSNGEATQLLRLRGGGLLSASVSRWQHDDPTRTEVREIMSLVMRTCVANTRPGDFARLEHALHGKKCYCYVISKQNGLAGTLVTDEAYPQRVAINLVDKILDEFEAKVDEFSWSDPETDDAIVFPALESLLEEFQDPAAADAVESLKKDIEESRQILQKSIDQVLQRGQKIEDLVMHSNKLSMQTKLMYKSVNQKPGWFDDCCGFM